jgi:hypothetical protein
MLVYPASERPFSTVQNVGIAVRQIERPDRPVSRHCGLLYKVDGGQTRLLHFAFHCDLRDELAKEPYLWANIGFDEINGRFVAAYAAQLTHNSNNIPYGLDASGSCFDPSSGDFIQPPLGKGLTCATFITAVLGSLGFQLLLQQSWVEREEDEEYGKNVVLDLKEYGASESHISAVVTDIGAIRFRPEEVAGASTHPYQGWPIILEDAINLAKQILADLDRATHARSS